MFRKLIPLFVAPIALTAQQPADNGAREITLQEALRLAKDNNAQIITANNNIRNANLQIRSSRAELFPSLTATAGQQKSAGDRLNNQTNTITSFQGTWAYNSGLSVNQPIFDAGKSFADVRTARANVAAQQAAEVTQEYSISQQVKQQYNAILAAKESEAAARAALAVAQSQLDITIAKVNAGAANVADSLNSVVAVGNAQLGILTAQQSLTAASAQLTRLVGSMTQVTATSADTVEMQHAPLDSAALIAMALDGPTIRQANANLTAANATEKSAKTAYFPTLNANASYSGSGPGSYGFGTGQYPYSHSIGLNLNFPIFNRYQRENSIAQAQISEDNALASIRDQKLTATQTIITELGIIHNDEAKIAVQLVQIRAAQEAIRVDQQRYQLGAGLLVTVLQDQQNLITAQQNLIATRLDLRNARAAIEAFIGRDLP